MSLVEMGRDASVLGTFVFEFATPGIGAIAAVAGARFVVFDEEHSGIGRDTLRASIAGMRGGPAVPVLRVAQATRHAVSGALDLGASAVIVPMVESTQTARELASYAYYPPIGTRGAAFGVAHDGYGTDEPAVVMARANDTVCLLPQIETAAGVEAAASIAQVPGISGLWLGQYDLSISLGVPGQFQHPVFLGAVEQVVDAARSAGIALGMMVTSTSQASEYIERGFSILAYGTDIALYQGALSAGLTAIRTPESRS
jgi:2-dehydro-3-deoxyglucarate aldolase/4-hydroxy-2-oxoheptanedioate aldolase